MNEIALNKVSAMAARDAAQRLLALLRQLDGGAHDARLETRDDEVFVIASARAEYGDRTRIGSRPLSRALALFGSGDAA